MIKKLFSAAAVVLPVSVLLAIAGCKENTTAVYPLADFEEYAVECDTVVPDNNELMSAMFSRAGNYFVVQNAYGNKLFSLLDENLAFVDTVVAIGQGPEELTEGMYLGQWSGNPANPTIVVNETPKQRLVSLSVNPFDSITTVLRFPASERFRPRFAFLRDDSLCVGLNIGVGQAGEVGCYNLNSREVSYYPLPLEFEKTNAFSTSQGSLTVNSENNKSAVAFFSFPGIVVYNDDFNVERVIFIGDSEVNTTQLRAEDRGAGFTRIMFSGDKFLALYKSETQGENRVLIFDKSFKPVASIPVGESLWFDVNETTGSIITTVFSAVRDAVVFVVYPLPQKL